MSYYFGGMNVFDSFNYAMTTTATGGFATHNTSTEFFHSPTLEYICTLFTFLSGINFTLLYAAVIKLNIKNLFKNSEFKFYIFLVVVFTAFIMMELMTMRHYDLEHAFRCGLFQVVSFITTTGLFNDDAATWPRYLGGIGSLHVLRGLLGQYEWRFEMHPRRDAGENGEE